MDNLAKFTIIFILIFINHLIYCKCFSVNFRESSDAIKVQPLNTHIFKREMTQFFDKASYSFNGFDKIESIPVLFPIDICVLNLEGIKYAAALHMNKDGMRHFAVYHMNNGSYQLVKDLAAPNATAMDCAEIGTKAYIAVAYNLTQAVQRARDGSPIFELTSNGLRAVQYFPSPNLVSMYLRLSGNDFFLLQTFANTKPATNLQCPYFIWSGTTFNKLGSIPCSNARHLEPFSIDYENYVAVANYADPNGRTKTYSEVYKFEREKKKFQLFQKINTNGAVDVKYFNVPYNEVRKQHFLVFGNSQGATNNLVEGKNPEADSIFYNFDKGQFVPYQKLSLYAVEKFLPVQNTDAEKFLLLVACTNQDTKIYNLNDWKFEESNAQFTEGALGRGVANMRTFQDNENSYLVIANELMMENETNIFLPIFKQEEHANALRQQIIEWAKMTMERLQSVDVEKLKEQVEAKLAKFKPDKPDLNIHEIPKSNIQTVITKSLVYPYLQFDRNYWQALTYSTKALNILEQEYAIKYKRLKREIHETNSQIAANNTYDLEYINVDTLRVRNALKATFINGVELEKPELTSITTKKTIVTGNYSEPQNKTFTAKQLKEDSTKEHDTINVENLHIAGKLNEYTWPDLVNNTLKREGLQFFKAPINISNLITDSILVASNEINEQNLSKLVSISEGSYVINQDIQFSKPIKAKRVEIIERLNNIHVHEQKLDVLLKQANETQFVEGAKRFENIRILQPITVEGPLLGKHLNLMAPNRAIHDNLVLHGNYVINADVTITKLLNATDIVYDNKQKSIRKTLASAINMQEVLNNVNLKFVAPIRANNSLLSFINAQDLQRLLRTNVDEIQVVVGKKLFQNTLEIQQGFSVVKILNDCDVEELGERLLLKHTNETIKVPMHFGKIIAKGVAATTTISLNNKNLSDYLTKTTTQHVSGTLNADQLNAKFMNVLHLNTNGKIFAASLAEIYEQKARNTPKAVASEILQFGHKFYGNIYVKNLKINTTINKHKIEQIEQQLQQLNGNIKYVGNFKFSYDMHITNLTFQTKLNGITATEFGQCWLQNYGPQTFSAPQTFASVNCTAGMQLKGRLNGHSMQDYFDKTYWLQRNEFVNDVVFASPIQMQAELQTKTINGLHVPQDILYQQAKQPQILGAHAIVQRDLHVRGDILNSSMLNGLQLPAFQQYLQHGYVYDQTLYVEHAHFNKPPRYATLNRHNLKHTLDTVWLANENVDLQQHVELSHANFDGLLEFEGAINNMNLRFLQENYFSLTRAQQITTQLHFANVVKFEHDVHVDDLQLYGTLIDSQSNIAFNFDKFVANTLKTNGPHEITGIWSMPKVIAQGDLNNVRINNLNLAEDVVRFDVPLNEITAEKYITAATAIEKLYATPRSTINNIGVANWIRDTVYVYENYTIQGVTTLDTVNLYNDLCVHGSVNNITNFNEYTLLLRDNEQLIQGDVFINNQNASAKHILTNNFENLQAELLNGLNIEQFLSNRGEFTTSAEVKGHLIFKQALKVQEYHGSDDAWREFKWKRNVATVSNQQWNQLGHAVEKLKNSLAESHYALDYFEIRQVLRVTATQLIPLTLRYGNKLIDIVSILNERGKNGNENLKFYRWEEQSQRFLLDEKLFWLPQEKTLIDLLKLAFENAEYLTETRLSENGFYENIITSETEELQEFLNWKKKQAGKIEVFEMDNKDCFAVYGSRQNEIPIYCLVILQSEKPKIKIYKNNVIQRANVKQILSLTNTTIALLYEEAVEIWNTSSILNMIQRLPLIQAKQLAIGSRNNIVYMAVLSDVKANSLHHGAVEIYSSVNAGHFVQLQTLECIQPQQIAFAYLRQSNDLLLHVLTASLQQSLIIYQYSGVMGFKKIIGTSTLPAAQSMEVIELKTVQRNFVALFENASITFVETVFKKI